MYNIYEYNQIKNNFSGYDLDNLINSIKDKIDNLIELSNDKNIVLIETEKYNTINNIISEFIELNQTNIFDDTELLNITVIEQIVSEESSVNGDYESQNIIVDKENMTIDYFISKVSNYGCIDYTGNDKFSFYTVNSEMDYKTGNETTYTIFINNELSEGIKQIVINKLKEKKILSK